MAIEKEMKALKGLVSSFIFAPSPSVEGEGAKT